ncbi:neuraminidase-like domain-containing protein [Paenibacillus sp. P36]|uniref:Tc toxin subunit A-related protein n=1 Tax=Paenibacillus sp. P36 TaxID=3342538 RepID=UPI0038B23575
MEKLDLFKANLKSDSQVKTLENLFQANNGNWEVIKAVLANDESFEPEINKLEFTNRLIDWSKGNTNLVSTFQQDPEVSSMRDIAVKLTKQQFVDKTVALAPLESYEDRLAYAQSLHRELFRMESTAMLTSLIRDPKVPILNDAIGGNVAQVLDKHPDFNIKTTSIYEILNNDKAMEDIPSENREAVSTQLKTLQRIAAVSPDVDAVPVLYNTKMLSAMQISAMPQTQFQMMMSKSGLEGNTLVQIHTNAQMVRLRNEHAIQSISEAYRGTGIAMIDNSMGKPEQSPKDRNLSWDLLFGDADFCECGECTSVYSAAAYYVELLQYIRNNNLDPDLDTLDPLKKKADPKDISGTPLEKLFDRRPDLGCLKLTCENTNTVLPYIDLANEVMENFVAFKRLKAFNVEDETSGELLAEPQNTEYQAYCILKNEVYPFTLPYHQPIDAERIYLKHLDTSRYELIKTFQKKVKNGDDEVVRLKNEALNRAADAEFLGLTLEEYVILTQECFETKDLMDKLKKKNFTDDEYRQTIGVKPVSKYYGFDDDQTMMGDEGLTLIKKQFLRRTGIDYVNLVELLKTEYINPNMPKGKSKAIMESLYLNYRFLQNYAKANGIDIMADLLVNYEELAALVPTLKEKVAVLIGRKVTGCADSDPNKPDISDKDIRRWVKCEFAKAGKMIVIESGRGCANGKVYKSVREIATREFATVIDCKIYNDDGVEQGAIDRKTGKVSLNEHAWLDANILQGASFVSDKGEKGVFMAMDGKQHLIYTEQKDSCDLDTAMLQHLDGTPLTVEEYDSIHRFLRLWRKLGWTISETDQAIAGLSHANSVAQQNNAPEEETLCENCGEDDCDCCEDCKDCEGSGGNMIKHPLAINPNLIHQLVAVKKLLDQTSLELDKLLTFWSPIGTVGEKSLYERFFLTHNVRGIDKIFKADDKGHYLLADTSLLDHVPVVMAALNLSADDIQAIIQDAKLDNKLTLSSLSTLYRYRLLSKALGLRIPTFIRILPLFEPLFADAHSTLLFLKRWDRMQAAGFTPQQLNYIIRGVDDENKPFAPSELNVLQLSKTLYDGLNAIDEVHQNLKADPAIQDPAAQMLNIQEQATGELVRSKASLLFESGMVDKIVGILEGTNVFKTKAPSKLNIALKDTQSLKNKLQYDPSTGILQITGILTEAEKNDYKAIDNSLEWANAFVRIQKQQDKMFNELLASVIEQAQTDTDKPRIITLFHSGDISKPLDKIPDGEADPNTAGPKRAAFLEIYLPYLRQQLSHRFVINTLAGFVGLDAKIVEALVSEVLKQDASDEPIYGIFENIKESANPNEAKWEVYVNPASDALYTFVVRDSDTEPAVSMDGKALVFTEQEDLVNGKEWWSDTQTLHAGTLVNLVASGIHITQIYWKTPSTEVSAIPSTALIPGFATKRCEPALIALKKAAMLISTFELSEDEIRFIDGNKGDFGGFEFKAPSPEQWRRLEAYVRLRNSLPPAKLNMLGFWKWIRDQDSDKNELPVKIAELTTWKPERIKKLIAASHFDLANLEDYRNEQSLLKLQKALAVADKIGVDIDLLFDWAVPGTKFNVRRKIADSIKHAIRARYNQTDWEQVVKPLSDELRSNQKQALIAYLLQQKELIERNVIDANGLFEYFLIDVQMEPVVETSRIKQAISSVQLFVQRCFLGLEKGILPELLDRPRWDWMQNYRVWEANRKVFLYPENWILSNLRDDKSPFFKELESELLQKDITKQNVTDALKNYLYKLDEVSNMEVVGLYVEGTATDENAKLHIFARTRSAPHIFYYRYVELKGMNWYPWEKMQVDIPSYEVEKSLLKDTGSFLTPVVWNDRLLVFFPQIMKKTQSEDLNGINVKSYADDPGSLAQPTEYYEIKMAWSEYRNGKWTQKQVSTGAVFTQPIGTYHDLQYCRFIPIVSDSSVIINIGDQWGLDPSYQGAFEFNGSALVSTSAKLLNESFNINYFNQDNFDNMYSWQIDPVSLQRQNTTIYFHEDNAKEMVQGLYPEDTDFYYSNSKDLLQLMNSGKLEAFFNRNLTIPDVNFGPYQPANLPKGTNCIYHELKRPYSLYTWELFFHTPVMIANTLSKAQHYEEAMKWYHYVFNPFAEGSGATRFWQFMPFRNINSQRVLDNIFDNLKPNTEDQAINEWRDKPFMPHVVARGRPVAYMKWVVMSYVDNLIAWGDYLFRQDTIESINQAIQCYVLAGHIFGPQPMMIPKRGKIQPQTYMSLLDKWDAFGNAMVELELVAPFSNQTDLPIGLANRELASANIYGTASSLYFCIPNNPKLMGYWDTLADRLFKIRNSQNIEGVFRKLPLFEPPIDPALLVQAAAHGLSLASVLNDLHTPMPNYRFYYLLQKALELCNELKALGGAMLSAKEKLNNETITLLRAKHEGVMQNLLMEIKKKQLDEAQKNLESLRQNRVSPEFRMKYYLKLSGLDESLVPSDTVEFNGIPNEIVTVDGDSGLKLIPFEKEDMEKASEAQDFTRWSGISETLAGALHLIPNFTMDGKPFGVGAGVAWGGSFFGSAAQAVAKGLHVRASDLSFGANQAGKKGGLTRALQDRIHQASSAGFELKQIDKQIIANLIRIEIANQEIANQQKAIDNANEVEDFIRNKYSNEELYVWMADNLNTLHHQVYTLAYELAKKAELVYRFDRGVTSTNFIQSGYYDAGRNGLLAGEQLYVGLKQLEAAYQQERGYDYEIVKPISLYQINPLAVVQLREAGKCEFTLPEVLFDMDYPGHYKRRIKSVSLSIPCIVGPYTGVNATLSLLENKFRNTSIGGKDYVEDTEQTDGRFSTFNIPISAIAASSAQNDSGVFELSFKDERYLPFEGAGVISRWRLEMPNFRQFDYSKISDAILHVKYTSCEGGERLKSGAIKSLSKQLENMEQELNETGLHIALNLKHDLPGEWNVLRKNGSIYLKIDKTRLPFMAQTLKAAIENVMFVAKVKDDPVGFTIKIDEANLLLNRIDDWNVCFGNQEDLSLDQSFVLSVGVDQLKNLEELMLIVKYKF